MTTKGLLVDNSGDNCEVPQGHTTCVAYVHGRRANRNNNILIGMFPLCLLEYVIIIFKSI